MGLLKKKHKESTGKSSASIDEAMDELSRQTDALLDSFKETPKTPKPALPKKGNKPTHRGKSFDIIHDPRRKTQLKSTLKAAAPTESQPETPLIPEHATKSYNEVEASAEPTEANVAAAEVAPAVIKGHEARLTLSSQPEQEETATDTPAEPVVEAEVPEDDVLAEQELVEQSDVHEQISFSEDENNKKADSTKNEIPTNADATESQPDSTVGESEEAAVTPDSAETSAEDKKEETFSSGEIHANNLVKEVEPKGYQAPEETEGPAVFDTNEYHPELHDWSKLEHKTGSKWLLLVLLLVVACGLGYFVISGQQLPF